MGSRAARESAQGFAENAAQIRGSFAALQQVIQGLVSNAIQYRRDPAAVHITIQAKRQSADEWVVSVSDDGMGIDASHHQSIFTPLQRLHGNEIEGSGMGLAICKRIVEAHGGRIWVDTSPGQGSTFVAAFPLHLVEDAVDVRGQLAEEGA